jgi:hypothetical protein
LNISPPTDTHSTPTTWPGLPRSATPRSTSMAGTGPPADHPPRDSGRYEPIYSGSCTDPRHRPTRRCRPAEATSAGPGPRTSSSTGTGAISSTMIPGGRITGGRVVPCHWRNSAEDGPMRLAGDSLRTGTPRVNHAIHKAVITRIRHKYSAGRACYDKKIAEGKTRKEALRSLKRGISDAIYAWLLAEARQTAPAEPWKGPGGQPGNHFVSRAADSHPEHRLFGAATPDLTPPYGPLPRPQQPDRWRPPRLGPRRNPDQPLTAKGFRSAWLLMCGGVIPWRAQNWPIGCCAHPVANSHSCVMEVIARLQDQALCAEMSGSGPRPVAEPGAWCRHQPGSGRACPPAGAVGGLP